MSHARTPLCSTGMLYYKFVVAVRVEVVIVATLVTLTGSRLQQGWRSGQGPSHGNHGSCLQCCRRDCSRGPLLFVCGDNLHYSGGDYNQERLT